MKKATRMAVALGCLSGAVAAPSEITLTKPVFRWLWGGFGFHNAKSSMTGVMTEGCGEGAMYGTAKSGLYNFVKGLSQTGAAKGVRAFCVSPGPVMTRPGADNLNTLIPCAAGPIEVVDFILYLMSENVSYVTGSNHVIDGGCHSMQPPKKAVKGVNG